MIKHILFGLILVSIFSCSRDVVAEPDCDIITPQTYQDVKLILNASCSYTSCHLNNGAPGNFDNYESIKEFLDSNESSFRSEINTGDMPPDYAEDGKESISQVAKLQLACWLDRGYPEE